MRLTLLAVGAVTLLPAVPGTAQAAVPVPAKPSHLPSGVEAFQPYVGQAGCDPVAKPGVAAFQTLLMTTYRDTESYGIVRDCGIGGQSEHKEGRAFDWKVSAYNSSHVAEVKAVTDWLLAPSGSEAAVLARRFGIMYMIWNRQIWKAYQADRGWQPYSGASPHTDHVHFSFGWAGAKKATSWWSGRVAPIDYGPYQTTPPPPPPPAPYPATPDNLRILAAYGATTLRRGDTGSAVVQMQTGLEVTADGDFGPITEGKVKEFQAAFRLPVTGVFGPAEWKLMYPRPINPFGTFETLTSNEVSGWLADADTSNPIAAQVLVDRVPVAKDTADLTRPDVGTRYPGIGTAHGYRIPVQLRPGTHTVCVVGLNVGAGADTSTGCASITVVASPVTATSPASGVANVFTRSDRGTAMVRTHTSRGLGAEKDLGGGILGAPAAVNRTSSTEEVFVRGVNDVLYTSVRSGSTYGRWTNLGGQITSRPGVAVSRNGRVDLVARSADGGVVHRSSTSTGSWSAETSLGGKALAGAAPAIAWTRSGRLEAYVIGTDRAIYRKTMDASGAWTHWHSIGGASTSDLSAVATGYDEVTVVVRGTNDKAYVQSSTAAGASGRWTSLGGIFSSAPGITAAPGSRTPQVFGMGADGRLWRSTRSSGGAWSGWSRA